MGNRILGQFSKYRLNGEAIPSDVAVLLEHRKEFTRRTCFELQWKRSWAPWLDTSYLTKTDLKNPEIAANIRAIADVCAMIAFVAESEDSEYLGYWRGPNQRPIASSPIVYLDNEGQFSLVPGRTFADAVLFKLFDDDWVSDVAAWMQSLGVASDFTSVFDLPSQRDPETPHKMHRVLFKRYRAELSLKGRKVHSPGPPN